MPTMNGSWQHCALARSDLNRAVEEAVERVADWSHYGAVCDATFTFKSGLSLRRRAIQTLSCDCTRVTRPNSRASHQDW